MVKSETMDEAVAHSAKIEGVVGPLVPAQSEIWDTFIETCQMAGDQRVYVNRHRTIARTSRRLLGREQKFESVSGTLVGGLLKRKRDCFFLPIQPPKNLTGTTSSRPARPFLHLSYAVWQLAASQSLSMVVCLTFRSGKVHMLSACGSWLGLSLASCWGPLPQWRTLPAHIRSLGREI